MSCVTLFHKEIDNEYEIGFMSHQDLHQHKAVLFLLPSLCFFLILPNSQNKIELTLGLIFKM